jgi:hypothetical protein
MPTHTGSTITRAVVVAVATLAFCAPAFAQISSAELATCNARLEQLLLNKKLIAKVGFPASAQGIDLTLDGAWDQKMNSRRVKGTGLGIAVDDPAVVNQVKLKDDLLEIHLNGGGFGTFSDNLLSSEYQRQARTASAKASGGSRVNLRFKRPTSCGELANAERMMAFLAPLLDASALKTAAAQQAIAPEWAQAAAKKQIVAGMDKVTVFAILGEPKQKQVDMAVDPPIERWQFDMPNMKTRIVTFKAGKVTKVDEF